jgi:hemin transport system permease protein
VILALAQLRRQRGQFAGVTTALALISFLVIVLAGLSDGLWYGATGAIRNSRADLEVFSGDSLQTLTRSSLPAADADRIRQVPGVADVGAIGVLLAPATSRAGQADTAVIGFAPGRPGAPPDLVSGRLPAPGEPDVAVADATQAGTLRLGDRVTVEGSAHPLRVVGFVADARFQLLPTLWTSLGDWRTLRDRVQPELRTTDQRVQAVPVRVANGFDPTAVAHRIDAALGDTRTVTRDQAIGAIPGASQMRSTFTQIIVTTVGVAALVVALFFALITIERRTLLATLKALGSSGTRIVAGLQLQALLTSTAGLGLGALLAWSLTSMLPPTFPLIVSPTTAIAVTGAMLLTAAAGAGLSARRIARIDPAQALGGAL